MGFFISIIAAAILFSLYAGVKRDSNKTIEEVFNEIVDKIDYSDWESVTNPLYERMDGDAALTSKQLLEVYHRLIEAGYSISVKYPTYRLLELEHRPENLIISRSE